VVYCIQTDLCTELMVFDVVCALILCSRRFTNYDDEADDDDDDDIMTLCAGS